MATPAHGIVLLTSILDELEVAGYFDLVVLAGNHLEVASIAGRVETRSRFTAIGRPRRASVARLVPAPAKDSRYSLSRRHHNKWMDRRH